MGDTAVLGASCYCPVAGFGWCEDGYEAGVGSVSGRARRYVLMSGGFGHEADGSLRVMSLQYVPASEVDALIALCNSLSSAKS